MRMGPRGLRNNSNKTRQITTTSTNSMESTSSRVESTNSRVGSTNNITNKAVAVGEEEAVEVAAGEAEEEEGGEAGAEEEEESTMAEGSTQKAATKVGGHVEDAASPSSVSLWCQHQHPSCNISLP